MLILSSPVGKVTARSNTAKAPLPYLPVELLTNIAIFAGFREMFILHLLVSEVCPKHYLRDFGSPSLESAVDNGRVYEVQFRLWKNPQPKFRRTLIVARAIRMQRWKVIRCMITLYDTKPNVWDILEGVKNGIDPKTLDMMIETYQEPMRERLRPACLYQSELQNNSEIFGYILKECELQRRRRGQVRKIISNIEEGKWQRLIAHI